MNITKKTENDSRIDRCPQIFSDFHPLFSLLFVSCFVSIFASALCRLLSSFLCIMWLLYVSLCVPTESLFFFFYILTFLPPNGKKKISFSVSYSFPIQVLRAIFEAGNVCIQRSLFLEKL
jgi:hypothetical protein